MGPSRGLGQIVIFAAFVALAPIVGVLLFRQGRHHLQARFSHHHGHSWSVQRAGRQLGSNLISPRASIFRAAPDLERTETNGALPDGLGYSQRTYECLLAHDEAKITASFEADAPATKRLVGNKASITGNVTAQISIAGLTYVYLAGVEGSGHHGFMSLLLPPEMPHPTAGTAASRANAALADAAGLTSGVPSEQVL